jgi:hypothetical protein
VHIEAAVEPIDRGPIQSLLVTSMWKGRLFDRQGQTAGTPVIVQVYRVGGDGCGHSHIC